MQLYLEWVKPGFEQPISKKVYTASIGYFESLMQLLHPFMPFITEEIYHQLKEQKDDLCVKQFEATAPADTATVAAGELLKEVISALRDARNKNQLKPKEQIRLHILSDNEKAYRQLTGLLAKQINATSIEFTTTPVAGSIVVAVEKDKFFLETEKELDTHALKAELLKDLAHQQQFLESVTKKLSNERFVQNAKPEVVAMEQKKRDDATARIKTIEESLKSL